VSKNPIYPCWRQHPELIACLTVDHTLAACLLFSCRPLTQQLLRLLPLEPQLSALLGLEQQQQQGDTTSSSSSTLTLLLSAQPSLLRVDPASLAAAVAHLQELLGQAAAAAAVRKCPQVLGCSPFR
jgi:hypothetical protein